VSVISYPIGTEKSIRMMESENKLMFMCERKATKQQIKQALEELLKAKITNVNTLNVHEGKKAIVTFAPETLAIDIATKMGLM